MSKLAARDPADVRGKAARVGLEPDELVLADRGGVSSIRAPDGGRQDTYRIGRTAFERISAVEGIAPSREARERAATFDRLGLRSDQRRQMIIAAYRAKV